jgi:hypothetical protein
MREPCTSASDRPNCNPTNRLPHPYASLLAFHKESVEIHTHTPLRTTLSPYTSNTPYARSTSAPLEAYESYTSISTATPSTSHTTMRDRPRV